MSASAHTGIPPLCMGLETTPPGCGPGDPPECWLGENAIRVLAWSPPQARPLNFPPGCGSGDPPRPDPSTSPLGVGPETCKTCWDTISLETCKACWDTTCNACWDTTLHPPPWTEFLTHASEIPCPKPRLFAAVIMFLCNSFIFRSIRMVLKKQLTY